MLNTAVTTCRPVPNIFVTAIKLACFVTVTAFLVELTPLLNTELPPLATRPNVRTLHSLTSLIMPLTIPSTINTLFLTSTMLYLHTAVKISTPFLAISTPFFVILFAISTAGIHSGPAGLEHIILCTLPALSITNAHTVPALANTLECMTLILSSASSHDHLVQRYTWCSNTPGAAIHLVQRYTWCSNTPGAAIHLVQQYTTLIVFAMT
ncbi:hypothetical protein GWK47_024193 [Chionoecetes opilio]|uniref:Uncharacterized protein n=1 Tax=Chionoecetes opilio TaxID=41210 RepID=A0A8J5CDW3_CHIOP|nr:hypothetical protein GWK47_024193 [Chionoecetes opilio]